MDAGGGSDGGGVEVNQSAKDAGCRRRVGDDGGDATTEGCQKRGRRIGRGKVTGGGIDGVPLFLPPSLSVCRGLLAAEQRVFFPLVKGACERVVSPSALADVKSRMRRRLDDE